MSEVYIISEEFYAPECYSGHTILSVYRDAETAMKEFQTAKKKHDGTDTGWLAKDVLAEFFWWQADDFGDDVRYARRLSKKLIQ